MRYLSLAAFLLAFWLILSGHYTPMLVTAGVASAIICVCSPRSGCALPMPKAIRLSSSGAPSPIFPGSSVEIAKSGWAVTKVILHPRLPISPTMTVVAASQRTSVGVASYANSITLTPGTITVGVDGNQLTVHALVNDGALDLEGGGMDRRVSQFEGTA